MLNTIPSPIATRILHYSTTIVTAVPHLPHSSTTRIAPCTTPSHDVQHTHHAPLLHLTCNMPSLHIYYSSTPQHVYYTTARTTNRIPSPPPINATYTTLQVVDLVSSGERPTSNLKRVSCSLLRTVILRCWVVLCVCVCVCVCLCVCWVALHLHAVFVCRMCIHL